MIKKPQAVASADQKAKSNSVVYEAENNVTATLSRRARFISYIKKKYTALVESIKAFLNWIKSLFNHSQTSQDSSNPAGPNASTNQENNTMESSTGVSGHQLLGTGDNEDKDVQSVEDRPTTSQTTGCVTTEEASVESKVKKPSVSLQAIKAVIDKTPKYNEYKLDSVSKKLAHGTLTMANTSIDSGQLQTAKASPISLTSYNIRPFHILLDALGLSKKVVMPAPIQYKGKTIPRNVTPLMASSGMAELRKNFFQIDRSNNEQILQIGKHAVPGQNSSMTLPNPCKTKAQEYTEGNVLYLQEAQSSTSYQNTLYPIIQPKVNGQDLYSPWVESAMQMDSLPYSKAEITRAIQDKKIYTYLPREFLEGWYAALAKDNYHGLPFEKKNGERNVTFQDLLNGDVKDFDKLTNTIKFIKTFMQASGSAQKDDYNKKILSILYKSSLYEVGLLAVKAYDHQYLLVDDDYKLHNRTPGTEDHVKLLFMTGLRNDGPSNIRPDRGWFLNAAFSATLSAAGSGTVIFPAIGLGVFAKDDMICQDTWKAFFDAVIFDNSSVEHIIVNPGHKPLKYGKQDLQKGQEFQQALDSVKKAYSYNPRAISKLNRIINVYEKGTDIVHLAANLARDQTTHGNGVSLVIAGDPETTISDSVGQYANNVCHKPTIEENVANMSTVLLSQAVSSKPEVVKLENDGVIACIGFGV